jgi:hypothetical protein
MRRWIQTVIVIFIIGIVVSLFVVWTGKVRNAAAMTQCRNNLKQLALSAHSFNDVYRHFPPGTHWSSDPWFNKRGRNNLTVEKRASWIFILSPFCESMMDPNWKINPMKSWDDPENRYVREATLAFVICPLGVQKQSNVTHFVGIAGVGKNAATLPVGDSRIGFFGFDRLITTKDIKDGTANTISIAETNRDVGPWIAGGYTTTRGLDPNQPPYIGDEGQFYSRHGTSSLWGGEIRINAVFIDGSVRSFNETLDPKIWEALATIAGGEKVENPEEN